MKFILAERYFFPSANLLRNVMQDIINERIFITNNPNRSKDNLLVRYGFTGATLGKDTLFNSPEKIRLCSSKFEFSKLMQQNNINSPQFYKDISSLTFPCLIRRTLYGSGGVGIEVCENKETFYNLWNNSYYWTPFIYTKAEYRVHCLGGNIVKIFRKVLNPGSQEEKIPIRNLHKGYHFSLCNAQKFSKMPEFVDKILKALDMKFVALDIGFDGNNFTVFEGNSAPGLNELTAELYGKYIVENMEK